MATLTVSLSEDALAKLEQAAQRLGVSAEELARISLEELLARPDDEFEQAAEYVLQKNAELYRRLA